MGLFEPTTTGGVLTGHEIRRQVKLGRIHIDGFNEQDLNANSYNIRLGDTFTVYRNVRLFDLHDPSSYSNTETFDIDPEQGATLRPGTLYLIPTKEAFGSNYYEPVITGRSSQGRLGIEVHKEAGFGDIGYLGVWTLHVTVTYPTVIYPNDPVAQVYFLTPAGRITKLYDGKYQGSKTAVPSRWGMSNQDQ